MSDINDFLSMGGINKKYLNLKLDEFGDVGKHLKNKIINHNDYFNTMDHISLTGSIDAYRLGVSLIRAMRVKYDDNNAHVVTLADLLHISQYKIKHQYIHEDGEIDADLISHIYYNNHAMFISDLFFTNTCLPFSDTERYYIERYIMNRIEDNKLTILYSPFDIETLQNLWSKQFMMKIEDNFITIKK